MDMEMQMEMNNKIIMYYPNNEFRMSYCWDDERKDGTGLGHGKSSGSGYRNGSGDGNSYDRNGIINGFGYGIGAGYGTRNGNGTT